MNYLLLTQIDNGFRTYRYSSHLFEYTANDSGLGRTQLTIEEMTNATCLINDIYI